MLEEALVEVLPDFPADFDSDSLWASLRYANHVHNLSRVCRRIRKILLPKLYRFVRLLQPNNIRRLSFLELIPMYGHICEKLAFRIPGGGSFSTLVGLLSNQCKYFTNLRVLELDIRLDDDADASDKRYESSVFQHISTTGK